MVSSLKTKMKTESIFDESKIDEVEVIFICVDPEQSSPIVPLYSIIESYSTIPKLNLFMIVGDDRADFLDTLADSFLFKNPNIYSVNGDILKRANMDTFKNLSDKALSEINISDVPVSAFSASFVRKLVKLGMKDKFIDVYGQYLSPDQIDHLYDLISRGLQKPEPKSTSSSSAVNPLKYRYPIIRDSDDFNQYYSTYLENERIREEKKRIREEDKRRKEEEKLLKATVKATKGEKSTADRIIPAVEAVTVKKTKKAAGPDAGGSRKRRKSKRKQTTIKRKSKRRQTKRRKTKRRRTR